ncbi:hypothetical protein Abr02nite_16710 [Paractinoplanes brasiliensis]|nr:hypothetical protein Abr02nite_16710 [Actinoplanes brasiliensis]
MDPVTSEAEMAPGNAYAVEVTSISASARPVIVARADQSMAPIQISERAASRSPFDETAAAGLGSGATSWEDMSLRVRAGSDVADGT